MKISNLQNITAVYTLGLRSHALTIRSLVHHSAVIARPLPAVWHEYEYLIRDLGPVFCYFTPGGKISRWFGHNQPGIRMRWAIFHICSLLTLGMVQPCNNNLSLFPRHIYSSLIIFCFSELRGLGRGPNDHRGYREHDGGAGPRGDPQVCGDPPLWLQGIEISLSSDYKVTGHHWPRLATEQTMSKPHQTERERLWTEIIT